MHDARPSRAAVDGEDVAVSVTHGVDIALPAGEVPETTVDVTVVVTCFNQAPYILEAVSSALAQRPRPRVVVIDDGSTDDSVGRLEPVADWVTIVSTPNRGVAAARNRGLEAVTSDYVMFLDGDDRLSPGYLCAALQSLDADPSVGYAYPDMQEFGASTALQRKPEWDLDLLVRENFVALASVFRMPVLGPVRFDGSLPSLEDWDFVLALAERGVRGVHVAVPYGYRRFERPVSRSVRGARRPLHSLALHARIQWRHRAVVPLVVIVSSGIVRAMGTLRAKLRAVPLHRAARRQPGDAVR